MSASPASLSPRTLPVYLATIVAPVSILLWLGLQSFERQRQALAALTAEKLEAAVGRETRAAAEVAFRDRSHPIAKHFFTIEDGILKEPALHGALPHPAPPEFAEAERHEQGRPELALALYRRLRDQHVAEPLARARMARVLSKLGREAEARNTWRDLARRFPDERDLAGRPFGIVGALNADDTAGLFETISAGRWDLSADQAAFFLAELDAARPSPYLDRFRFARELSDQLKPQIAVREHELYDSWVGVHRVFYRADGAGRIAGFAADPTWTAALRGRLQRELGITDGNAQELRLYGGAVTVVLLVLSAGVALLWRDVSRERLTNRLQAELVSGVSHELKTPITLVRLYGETLLRQRSLPEEERREFYRIITRESARLGRLIDQILAFSRIERGDERYVLEEGDIAPVIVGVVDDYSEWLEQAGFVLERALDRDTPPVCFDQAGVSQAVVNLLDNAAKYSGPSRTIAVRLASAHDHVRFEVVDQGVGIAAIDRERIFDRFYRAPNSAGKGGYGLGLYMVRRMMEAHGGRAEVESEPGRGSTFRLVFPVASP